MKIKPGDEQSRAFYTLSLTSDMALMFLYYSNDDFPDSAMVQKFYFSSPDISVKSRNSSIALYEHDYSKADISKGGIDYRTINDTINPQAKGYVSGPAGLTTYVEIDTTSFNEFRTKCKEKGFSTIAIHKADLQWTITDKTWKNYDESYPALGLYYNFEGPLFMPDYNYLIAEQNPNLPTTLGGVLNRSNGIYHQDITRYVQAYFSQRTKKTKLHMSPQIPARFAYANAVVWGSNAPHPDVKPKLIITYTLLK